MVGGIGQDHGDALALESLGHDARVHERVPGHLDHQALLRLHADGIARRESERGATQARRGGWTGARRAERRGSTPASSLTGRVASRQCYLVLMCATVRSRR